MSKNRVRDAFGGHLLKNSHAKSARPLSGTSLMQIVMTMRQPSVHPRPLRKALPSIRRWTKAIGNKHRVQIKAITWKKHQLQLVVRLTRKKRYLGFIRSLSGTLALQISGANKFQALHESFWQGRPWTGILEIKNEISTVWEQSVRGLQQELAPPLLGIPRAQGP